MSLPTNDIKFNVTNGLAVGASGFEVINTAGEWVGASGPGQSPYGATGAQGVTADTGATGVQGASGVIGVDGSQGATGDSGTLGASGITGGDGDTGVAGDKGATGSRGDTGPDGDQGVNGDQGARGVTGDQGPTGPGGDQGVTGATGLVGSTGPTGEIGATGTSGVRYKTTSTSHLDFGSLFTTSINLADNSLNYSTGQVIIIVDLSHANQHFIATVNSLVGTVLDFTVISFVGTGGSDSWAINLDGAEGAVGASGVTGGDGQQGTNGDQGPRGVTGGGGDGGITGEQGTVGPTGATGTVGATGSRGDQGPDGDAGYTGATGTQGARGTTGDDGAQGADGSEGSQGDDGATGVTGATGAQGGDGSGAGGLVIDTVNSGPYLTYSNGNRTVIAGGTQSSAITTTAINNGDMVWFSVSIDALTAAGYSTIGIGNSSFQKSSFVGNDANSVGFSGDGYAYYGSSPFASSFPTWTAGSIVDVAVQIAAGDVYLWIRVDGGYWNNNASSNPATFSYGLAAPYGAGYPVYAALGPNGADQLTIQSTATYSAPSGFIFLGGSGGPTNTGYTGSTGATGAQGGDGNKGYDGATGTTGDDGATGVHGATGVYGTRGTTGDDGATGYLGDDGATGVYGATGVTGDNGTQGVTGEQGHGGATGTQGASGVTGDTGTDGATGSYGLRFKTTLNDGFQVQDTGTGNIQLNVDTQTGDYSFAYSAGQRIVIALDSEDYCVALVNSYDTATGIMNITVEQNVGTSGALDTLYVNLDGAVGIEGVIGVTGPGGATGTVGDMGTTGDTGSDGYQGATGATGIQGASGVTGDRGDTGVIGSDGDIGNTGPDGATGIQGASGPTGVEGDQGHAGATGFSLAKGSTGLTGTSLQTIDIFAANEIGTAKYLVQGVDGSTNVQATEVILTQNGSGLYITEYATLRTGAKVMDVTATTNGSVISFKVTPQSSGTNFAWVRESVMGRIGGTTVNDDGSNIYYSFSHSDNGSIPVGEAYVYPSQHFIDLINFTSLIGTSVTFDAAGVGPQNPAVGEIVSWDGVTLVVTITSGNFTSRTDLDKITYGY